MYESHNREKKELCKKWERNLHLRIRTNEQAERISERTKQKNCETFLWISVVVGFRRRRCRRCQMEFNDKLKTMRRNKKLVRCSHDVLYFLWR